MGPYTNARERRGYIYEHTPWRHGDRHCGSRKTDFAKARSANHVIDYAIQDFRNEVLKLTGGRGVDRVYDPVGGEVFAQSLRCMAVESRICPSG